MHNEHYIKASNTNSFSLLNIQALQNISLSENHRESMASRETTILLVLILIALPVLVFAIQILRTEPSRKEDWEYKEGDYIPLFSVKSHIFNICLWSSIELKLGIFFFFFNSFDLVLSFTLAAENFSFSFLSIEFVLRIWKIKEMKF